MCLEHCLYLFHMAKYYQKEALKSKVRLKTKYKKLPFRRVFCIDFKFRETRFYLRNLRHKPRCYKY